MSTDDVIEDVLVCPCGKSTVTFRESVPDHAFARESQRTYSAQIECQNCRADYVVQQCDFGEGKRPIIVARAQVEMRAAATARVRQRANEAFMSPAGIRLQSAVAYLIDAAPSMAARHRLLKEIRVAHDTLPTFRRRPFGGDEAVRRLGPEGLIKLGALAEYGGDDAGYFANAAREIAALKAEENAIRLEPISLTRLPSE